MTSIYQKIPSSPSNSQFGHFRIERKVKTAGHGDLPNRPSTMGASLNERGVSAARHASTVSMDAASLPQVVTATKRDRRMRDTIFERR